MNRSTRILLGILFPVILLVTVTSISKALKTEEKSADQVLPSIHAPANKPNSVLIHLTSEKINISSVWFQIKTNRK